MPAARAGLQVTAHMPGASCWGQTSAPSPNSACMGCVYGFTGKLQAGPAGEQEALTEQTCQAGAGFVLVFERTHESDVPIQHVCK